MHADMVFLVLGLSLAAIMYLILVRGCSTPAPFLSCLGLMTFSSSSRSPMICTCKHDPALFILGVLMLFQHACLLADEPAYVVFNRRCLMIY